ncbi:prolyl endopeptidase-like [Leptopilina heterotoma]|uniref:prolyl endopeptidase-like n=1 Tax=Leptopilina heterotoma TaxID=63436 RepID=UPI001CA9D902|nr:prolyl endopeptidase-like [Leptopilina heterotoma]
MKFLKILTLPLLQITLISGITEKTTINYPEIFRDDIIDDYHGIKVADPFRWLENLDSQDTKNFISAQNSITDTYLNSSVSFKENIYRRLQELDFDYLPYHFCPERHGNKYYSFKIEGPERQGFLYVHDTLDGEQKLLLDPNTLSTSKRNVSIGSRIFSDDGTMLAYILRENSSNWNEINFLNLETGEKYADTLKKVIYTVGWTHDKLGIFYTTVPHNKSVETFDHDSLENMKIYYHKFGTQQTEDILVVEFPEQPHWKLHARISDCGQWLLVLINDTGKNLVYFTELNEKISGHFNLTQIVNKLEAFYKYIGNDGSKALFLTDKNAPNKKIIAVDLLNYKEENWTILLPEKAEKLINAVTIVDNDKFIVQYYNDVRCILQLRKLNSGKLLQKVNLGIGKFFGRVQGNRKYPEYMFSFSSYVIPAIMYKLNVNNFHNLEIYRQTEVPNFNKFLYKVVRIFCPSKDNRTEIPMTIFMRKGAKLDGSMPALIYPTDKYGVCMFSNKNIIFAQHLNGIVATVEIREYENYPRKLYPNDLSNYQSSIDDFQEAVEYLIKTGYTSNEKLIIKGNEDKGLLVGACLNQRPDLFGAAIIVDGLLDMLRFHLFTADSHLISDYGTSDDPKNFHHLVEYSPLHNVKAPINYKQYPAILVLVDYDYIVPFHSLKFIATLQHEIGRLKQQTNTLMAKIDFDSKDIDISTAIFSFVVESLKLKFYF